MKRPRVTIIYKTLPQYRVRFFEQLRRELEDRGIEFNLVYGDPAPPDAAKGDCVDLSWAIKIRNRHFRFGSRWLYWQPYIRGAMASDLVIVEQANKLLLNYVLHFLRALGLVRFAYWGHGVDFQARGRHRVRETLKRFLATHVDWWFSYNATTTAVVESFGFPQTRVTEVQNAVETTEMSRDARSITNEERQQLRAKYGVMGSNVAIYVGGLYHEKRIGFLIAAADRIREGLPDFELIVAGSGSAREEIEAAAAKRPWLHYVGPMFGREKVALMTLAKLMLMPGLVGLVILDSFAVQRPIITTSIDYHSPEISYLDNGVNGLIVSPSDDTVSYAAAVMGLMRDEARLADMRAACEIAATRYTVEEMASRFSAGIAAALERR